MKKLLIGVAVVGAAVAISAMPAFAHGGNSRKTKWYVPPTDKNCMGQLARMHARDEKFETNGLPASFKMSKHDGAFDLVLDSSVHDTMHAFKDYCKMEQE